jgi:hypothetical protein
MLSVKAAAVSPHKAANICVGSLHQIKALALKVPLKFNRTETALSPLQFKNTQNSQ